MLRSIITDLDASKDKYEIDQLAGQKYVAPDGSYKQTERPFTKGSCWWKPNSAPTITHIDAQPYTFDNRTWSFPQALAHELLHAHDYYNNNLRGHGEGFYEDEKTVTDEAGKVSQ
jgi:hypothetical protein